MSSYWQLFSGLVACQYRSRNRSPHSHFWCAAVFLRVLEFLLRKKELRVASSVSGAKSTRRTGHPSGTLIFMVSLTGPRTDFTVMCAKDLLL